MNTIESIMFSFLLTLGICGTRIIPDKEPPDGHPSGRLRRRTMFDRSTDFSDCGQPPHYTRPPVAYLREEIKGINPP